MLDKYIDFINRYISDIDNQKVLLTVSGGVDSMVLLDLSIQANLSIAVAHVNHAMRGSESDADETLVRDTCAKHDIVFHLYRFTEEEKSVGNFQESAREIRYRWWNELCDREKYSHILTAHHSSDIVETFLLNLTRGSGINGLSSIPIVNQNILRPLYNISKDEIMEYANLKKVVYREDSSNQESKYKRNKIRNNWIPFLKNDEPNIENAIAKSVSHLTKEKSLLYHLVQDIINDNSVMNAGYQSIALGDLIDKYRENIGQLLYHYLGRFGFSEDSCKKCLTAEVGAEFHSETHDLLRDRVSVMLRRKTILEPISIVVNNYGVYQLDRYTKLLVSQDASLGGLAVYGLKFPFKIRHRLAGDRFKPSGMQGATQKLKDFLTNAKLNKWTKQKVLIVEYRDEIAALLSLRVSYGYSEPSDGSAVYITIQ